jgi:autotransporter-associated beta strand protein
MKAIGHRVRAAILMMVIGAGISASAATATWTGGHTAGNWGNAANWGGTVPTFNNQLDIIFHSVGAGQLENYVQETRTIRSLTFNENVDSDVIIRLTSTTAGAVARGLRFESNNPSTISPSITVDSGAAANIDIGGAGTAGTMGNINLSSTLAVTHNGSGLLTFSRAIGDTGGITKDGTGTMVFSGVNTYNGDTTINAGTLSLLDNAGMRFVIGASGVNNKLTGAGNATLGGDFYFDLAGAGTTVGDSWTIADLSGTLAYENTFTVNGFTDAGSGLWTTSANGADYQFSESTGILTVIPEPATIGLYIVASVGLLLLRRYS